MRTNSVRPMTTVMSRRKLCPYRLCDVICMTIAPHMPQVMNTSRAAITHTLTVIVHLFLFFFRVVATGSVARGHEKKKGKSRKGTQRRKEKKKIIVKKRGATNQKMRFYNGIVFFITSGRHSKSLPSLLFLFSPLF